jgi:hypothetical protein
MVISNYLPASHKITVLVCVCVCVCCYMHMGRLGVFPGLQVKLAFADLYCCHMLVLSSVTEILIWFA